MNPRQRSRRARRRPISSRRRSRVQPGGDRSLAGTRYTPAELAAVLQKTPAGESITVAMIQADVESAPALLADGKVDLVKYTAWLLKRHGYAEKGAGGAS